MKTSGTYGVVCPVASLCCPWHYQPRSTLASLAGHRTSGVALSRILRSPSRSIRLPLAVRRLRTLVAASALALSSASAGAQVTNLIDPADPAYRELDQLIANNLIGRLSLGQRPISRELLARAIDQAARNLSEWEARLATGSGGSAGMREDARIPFLRELLESLRSRFRLPDSSSESGRLTAVVAPIRSVALDGIRSDGPTRLVPTSNGLGSIDAQLNPLLANRQGRSPSAGSSALLETSHSIETDRFAFAVTPQLSMASLEDGSQRMNLRIQELELRALFRNIALDVGREYVVWGQGRDIGLLNSNNSPPLDLAKLSSEVPFRLPWFFWGLGPTRLSLVFATLGADQNFPHPYAVAYRANIEPANWLELGTSVYTKSGGRGAPPATTTARLIDLLPFLDASAYNNVFGTRGDFQFSDHYAGFDGRLRLTSIASSVFWEVLLNDFDVRRLTSVLWEDAGHVFGADLPPLLPSGRFRASVEYHHTGIRYYEHEQFTSGQTLHHVLTGDPLGPNGQGGYLYLDWFESLQRRLGLQLALERRSNDQYVFVPEPSFGFRRVEVRPKEWRGRAVGSWQLLPRRGRLGGLAQFGYERTRNFDFIHANDRNGFLARVALQYRFE